MKKRVFTQGVTIFTTTGMYEEMKRISDEQGISLSQLFRDLVSDHLESIKTEKIRRLKEE
ncbi:MAG: hypothetical protein M0Q01_03845 [Syntrophales bacterium]|jgi:hypothetical protein|nr:hypothetical protein [Syntrophales bacterium]